MTVEIVSILEELNKMMRAALEQAEQARCEHPGWNQASYCKGYADALGQAWEVVFNKAHMSEEDISI